MTIGYSVAAVRHPLGIDGRWTACICEGKSVAELVELVPVDLLPAPLKTIAVVRINGTVVPRGMWRHVRPKTDGATPVAVTISLPLQGGDQGGGKSVLAAVAAIAILVVAAVAAPYIAGALYTAGTLGFKAVSAAVLAAGSSAAALAAAALTPPPAIEARADQRADSPELGSAFANGNILAPDGPIPIVIGRRKVFPPLACQPLVEIIGNDEVIEAIYVLNGPHDLANIKIGNVEIEDFPGVTYETREGWDSDAPIASIRRYADTQSPNTEVIKHRVDPDNPRRLETGSNPQDSLPKWQRFVTTSNPDEIWLALSWGQGLVDASSPSTAVGVPIRIRMRRKGAVSWTNLPEIHFTGQSISTYRKQLKLIWRNAPPAFPSPPNAAGPYAAFRYATGQDGTTAAPVTTPWEAHSDYGSSGFPATGVALYQDRAEVYLSDATFPRGHQYEVEVMMGALYTKSTFNPTNYTYSSVKIDFFAYDTIAIGFPAVPRSLDSVSYDMTVTRVSSVYRQDPIQKRGLATIAIVGKNVSVDEVSTEAARYVPDWDGSSWSNWVVTSNPAPHYRDILTGAHTVPRKRVPDSEVDDAGLIAWRSWCASEGLEIAAVIDGASMGEVLTAVASTAYARPVRSHTIGVMVDKDRTDEVPVQIFTPRNARSIGWRKTFTETPDAYRVTFVDKDDDWTKRQILVPHPDVAPAQIDLIETITYDAMTDEGLVTERAVFDLDQLRRRSTTYSLTADVESLVCQRGSLVGVSTDEMIEQAAWGRIIDIARDGDGNIVRIVTDATVDILSSAYIYDVADFYGIPDFYVQGVKTGLAIRAGDGPVFGVGEVFAVTEITWTDGLLWSNGSGWARVADGEADLFELATPLDDSDVISVGDLAVFGPIEEVYRRMIVTEIKPGADLTATLTLVDEAPELHA